MSEEKQSAKIIRFPLQDLKIPKQGNAAPKIDDEELVDSAAVESVNLDAEDEKEQSVVEGVDSLDKEEDEVIDISNIGEEPEEEISLDITEDAVTPETPNFEDKILEVLVRVENELNAFETSQNKAFDSLLNASSMLAFNVAKKLSGEIASDYEGNIKNFFKDNLKNLIGESCIIVKIHPDLAEKIEDKLQNVAKKSHYKGELKIVGDDSLTLSDCTLDWLAGAIKLSQKELLQKIDELMAKYTVKIEEFSEEVQIAEEGSEAKPDQDQEEQVLENEVLQKEESSGDIGEEKAEEVPEEGETLQSEGTETQEEDKVDE